MTAVQIDFLVPTSLGGSGRRGARLGSHGTEVARKATGLEAALVDHTRVKLSSLEAADTRTFDVSVAGIAALLVAKLHKIAERKDAPARLQDKDALDILRLLRFAETGFHRFHADEAGRSFHLRRGHASGTRVSRISLWRPKERWSADGGPGQHRTGGRVCHRPLLRGARASAAGRMEAMSIRADGDIYGAADRFYDDALVGLKSGGRTIVRARARALHWRRWPQS